MSLLLMQGRKVVASVGGSLSLTLDGSAQSLSFAEPLGEYPDGSARTLFVQFTRSLTNGTPVSGTLTVTNRSIAVNAHRWGSGTASTLVSFGVPLQPGDIPSASRSACTTGTWTDDSATWVNSNTATWESAGAGLPAGVLVPSSATHLCASSSFGPLVAESVEPSFTGRSTATTAIKDTVTIIQAWNGQVGGGANNLGGASYETTVSILHLWMTTGDIAYLKLALSFAARMRTAYWYSEFVTNNFSLLPEWEVAWKAFTALYLFRRDTEAVNWIKKGLSFYYGTNPATYWDGEGARFASGWIRNADAAYRCGITAETSLSYPGVTNGDIAQTILTHSLRNTTDKMWFNDQARMKGWGEAAKLTIAYCTFSYASAQLLFAAREFCTVLPSSANRTALLARVKETTEWLYTNMKTTSPAGTISYWYANGVLYDDSGTVQSGDKTDSTTVTLNQFLSLAFAYYAADNVNATYAGEARSLYASIGLTPRDNNTGPQIGASDECKKWSEVAQAKPVMALLVAAGV